MGQRNGSGTFVGHAIPGSFFLGFAIFFLVLTFKRCRELVKSTTRDEKDGVGRAFCEAHVPEQSTTLLKRTGILLVVCTSIGLFWETLGGVYDHLGFFHQLAHQGLYLSFSFVGAVAYLESRQLVAPDSSRIALSFAFLVNYVLWNEHGLMKDDATDARVHLLQAQVNLVAAVAFGYSVHNPKSLLAFVSGWALMALNGAWMLTAGLNACCVDIMRHTVGAALVLESLLLATVITVGAVLLSGPKTLDNQKSSGKVRDGLSYSSVSVAEAAEGKDELEVDVEEY